MGREIADAYPSAREVFERADEALGFAISALCFEGAAEDLQLTENTQPAILTTSIATLSALEAEGIARPSYVAGHSLGEYSALVAAGALAFEDAVRIVRLRGRYMQEAVPVGVGAMAAVLGADLATIAAACEEASGAEVCAPANINSPNQIVIAGHVGAVERAMSIVKERGAKRAIKLPVSAPFHSPLMLPAQERLAIDLTAAEFNDFPVPLVTNVDAEPITLGTAARDALVRQVSAPVRWSESVKRLRAEGVTDFVEVGPGKVLAGLVRQIDTDARATTTESLASMRLTVDGLRVASA